MLRRPLVTAVLIVLAATFAAKADTVIVQRSAPMGPPAETVRVQVAVNFFVPAPTNDSEPALQAQERARRAIYETAARECDVLRAVLASDCRLEAVNVTINRQWGQQQQEGFTASGNLSFRVTLK